MSLWIRIQASLLQEETWVPHFHPLRPIFILRKCKRSVCYSTLEHHWATGIGVWVTPGWKSNLRAARLRLRFPSVKTGTQHTVTGTTFRSVYWSCTHIVFTVRHPVHQLSSWLPAHTPPSLVSGFTIKRKSLVRTIITTCPSSLPGTSALSSLPHPSPAAAAEPQATPLPHRQ